MENTMTRDFIVKFNKLTQDNQRYLIGIQQALTFAQGSSSEDEKAEKENRCESAS